MKSRVFYLAIGAIAILSLSASASVFQVQAPQNRIPQQIVINGQMANGAYVTTASGQMQSFSCPSPQQYATPDGRSQGWACYEQTTGVWLLNALPPTQAQAQPAPVPVVQQPQVVYQQAPPAVVYQQAPPTVIYQQPSVIYQPVPTVVYAPPQSVVVAPVYPSSVILGTAAINAAGRIASAAIISSHHGRNYYYVRGRRW